MPAVEDHRVPVRRPDDRAESRPYIDHANVNVIGRYIEGRSALLKERTPRLALRLSSGRVKQSDVLMPEPTLGVVGSPLASFVTMGQSTRTLPDPIIEAGGSRYKTCM